MIVKKHSANKRLVLAVCDSEILGKVFEEENLQLDLSSDFYKGEEMNKKELRFLIKKADIINAVGNEAVDFFMREKLIEKKDILYIKKIPYVQIC